MSGEKQKKVNQELQKQLEAHWKNTEKERKRTHSGKMYEKYMEEYSSENFDVVDVDYKCGECCYCLLDDEYVDMGAVKCKYGKSCILPSEVCSEVDSYKNCEMYETMVYMKAEYEKIGVYDMFVD